MAIKIDKLRQVTASVFVVLSLFVSSVSACACACVHHHEEQESAEQSSCHEEHHYAQAQKQEKRGEAAAPDDAADVSCECFVDTPAKGFVKSEKLKLEKQAIASTRAQDVPAPVLTGIVYLPAGSYSSQALVSDHFYNLTPGRAPPGL